MHPFSYAPVNNPLVILHLDDDLLLVDKPSGLLSVPGKALEHADCLETRVKDAFPAALLVHRLDMDTSGLMVFAMNKAAQRHLGLQFERRHVEKTYVAEVFGNVKDDEGKVELPLIVDWPHRPLQKVCFETGKAALTHFQVVHRGDKSTRMRLLPKTGRSHQLRVHMRELGHPILGDKFYATGEALAASERLMLHSESLTIYHPNGGARAQFECPCPF
jgi:tRNA pseudouridine32 synthase / 23S rRNA pseudouridine746 synthase